MHVYYKKYETPIPYIDKITGKQHFKEGELVCDHPLVERVWAYGTLSIKENSEAEMWSELLMKDGSRQSFKEDKCDYSKINEFLSKLSSPTSIVCVRYIGLLV